MRAPAVRRFALLTSSPACGAVLFLHRCSHEFIYRDAYASADAYWAYQA
jgi:hypothetical protein